jgi:photosystem II stability/assembly factor-like uncharacterized protein
MPKNRFFHSLPNTRMTAMRKIITFFALFISVSSLLAQPKIENLFGSLRARQIGPATTSGRISSLDAVWRSPEIIYAGSAGGGVWKTVNGGASFFPIFDDHCMSIGKVCIDQKRPDTVWVGTGEPWVRNSVSIGDGIYKTVNGGKSWQHLGLENTERIGDILIHPENPDIVYVAALGHLWNPNPDRGVYQTTDGGKSWKKILFIDENTGATDLAMDPRDPAVLYAVVWSHRRYPDFFDSGLNGKSGLHKSTDGGQTWKLIHEGLPKEPLGRLAVAVAPSNGNTLYLSVECKSKEGKGLYVSNDQGANWKRVSTEFNTTVRPFYFSLLTVDPKNDSIVMKAGLSLIVSEDMGKSFRSMDNTVHSDVHDMWIDPNNTKHVVIATDGGIYESFDRARTFKMFMNLPVAQFYHVSADNETPYNVYGGLQDNGSWFAPSAKAGGIANADWKPTLGGDGFWSFPHPRDHNIVFSEYQGGNLVKYNKITGMAKDIRPFPLNEQEKLRFNWNAPIHISPNNPNRMYFGAQFLFMSEDMGDSWKRISPDLSTNDPQKQRQKQSGGLTIDNSGAETHCTLYAIAESPKNEKIVWAGTDDGNLQVSANGGETWANVAPNIAGLPKGTWVSGIEPGHFDAQTAFVAFDGHRSGDKTTYIFKTTDLGKTWVPLATADIKGHAFCIKEDLVNPNLLFLGTEFGLYVSIDGGKSWGRFANDLPKVAVYNIFLHPKEPAAILATHGRGVAILDDISPLRQLDAEVVSKPFHIFTPRTTYLRDPGSASGWFGGAGNFVGPNPGTAATIVYYMNKRHTFGKMYVEVWKDGKLVKTLPAGKSAGINIVEMPVTMEKPKSAPSKNTQALFGAALGPNLEAGTYQVKVIKDKNTYETTFTLAYDPKSPYSAEERATQRSTTMRLYRISEDLAFHYAQLDSLEKQALRHSRQLVEKKNSKLKTALEKLARETAAARDAITSTEGDGYVNEDERLRERISDLYRQVSAYPGQPTNSHLQRTESLEQAVEDIATKIRQFMDVQLTPINPQLVKLGLPPVSLLTREEFMQEKGE